MYLNMEKACCGVNHVHGVPAKIEMSEVESKLHCDILILH